MSAAAKWHREQAHSFRKAAELNGYRPGHSFTDSAIHHATAADALEALAVVADLLAKVGEAHMVTTYREDDGIDRYPTDAQRAALATLAKIARGE